MPKKEEVADDAEHEVMYISPGDCRGDGGRTYGWRHAKDAEERASLVEQGYHPSLPEAYKAGGKPLAKRELAKPADWKPGNKAADAPAKKSAPPASEDEDERDPITGDDGNPETPSLDDVKAALGKLKEAKDAKAVTKLLKQFGAASAPALEESKYAEVIAAADKARAE